MFDQQRIARDIKHYCRTVFSEDNQTYTDEDIRNGIIMFFNLMRRRTPFALLNGFQEEMENALTKACIEEQGELSSLLLVATRLDCFLKRMYSFVTNINYSVYGGKTQGWLVNNLPGFPNVDGYTNDHTRETWKGNGSGAYPITKAMVIRNIDTHNSPDWDKAQVFEGLRYCLASFILIILKLKSQLENHISDLYVNPIDKSVTEEELQAFDFINYSRLTRALRSQVMECFIQRTLFKEGKMEEVILEEKVHEFIGKKTGTTVKHRIVMLEHRGLVEREDDGKLRLSDKRFREMEESENNCITNLQYFKANLSNLLTGTVLNGQVEVVYAQLHDFLKSRYQETTGATFEIEDYDITGDTNGFLDWLKDKIGDEGKAKKLYREIIELCRHNDIAYKLSIGKAIAALADSKEEALMAANMTRSVYLDTQVVLPMLCVAHKDFCPGDLWIFKNALQIKQQGKKEHINLRFAKSYLPEIYGHAQQAMKLSDWSEFPTFGHKDFSQNVFYQHFIQLKRLEQLPADALTYPEYIATLFSVEPDEIKSEKSRGKSIILNAEIDRMLEEDLHIELHTVPFYGESEIKTSQEVFNNVIRESNSTKGDAAAKLDAIMGKYLFEGEETPRPMFVTRDTTFNPYREQMARIYGRRNNYIWHLFSPTRFVVSNELTGMTINKDLLSDELLMLLDNSNARDNAKRFMDVNSRLTDIEGLDPVNARKRMKENFTFFSKQEIVSGSEEELEYLNELASPLNTLWDDVRARFSRSDSEEQSFHLALLDDHIYSELMRLMASYINSEVKNRTELFSQIEKIIIPMPESENSTSKPIKD